MQPVRASPVLWGRRGAGEVGKGRQAAVKGGDDWPLRYTIWGSKASQVRRNDAKKVFIRPGTHNMTLKVLQDIIFAVLIECISSQVSSPASIASLLNEPVTGDAFSLPYGAGPLLQLKCLSPGAPVSICLLLREFIKSGRKEP